MIYNEKLTSEYGITPNMLIGNPPVKYSPVPTKEQYQSGILIRYFVKKVNEDKIIDIFTKMEESKAGYAGIWWDVHKDDISTDIFFADTRYGNIFETLIVNDVPDHLIHRLEVFMYQIINATNINVHYLEDRWPTWSDGRWQCDKLGWTMSHDLQTNINYLNSYKNESSIVGEN